MNDELSDIHDTIFKIYEKNLNFLKKNFNSLYEEIDYLSNAIENGLYQEKYTLELVDGYFDILNNENNGYFYNVNSYDDADSRAAVTSFDTSNSFDLLRKNQRTNKLLESEYYKDVVPIIAHINEVVDFEKVEFQKIFKFIYIGTGLGLHIQQIDKKINSLTTLIIEEDLEIFRLSLFVTDYSVFEEGNRKLFLSIGDDKVERNLDLMDLSNYHKYMNYNVKYNTLLASGQKIKDDIALHFSLNSNASFPYKIMLQNLERMVGFINNKDRFLNANTMKDKKILKDRKVLIISAGPSLDTYIDWIRDNQELFIIVCVDVIVKKLEINSILPDIIVSIDQSHLCASYVTTKDPDYLNDSAFLFLSQQSPEIMEVVKDKHYYFSQVMPLIPEIGFLGSTPNVGTYSFELTTLLGSNELYLIGCDAAFNQKTGNRYASDSGYRHTDNINNQQSTSAMSLDDVITTKGNLRTEIKTNGKLYGFKDQYEASIRALKAQNINFTAFNLSDGAYIEGLTPLTKEELENKTINFIPENKNMIEEINNVSQIIDNLNSEDDIIIINSILSRIRKFQKIEMSSKDDFLEKKLDLMIWILEKTKEMNSTLYGRLFLEYTSLVDIYINYLLNLRQKDLHKKEEMNKISKMWSKGTLIMFKEIKDSLKQ